MSVVIKVLQSTFFCWKIYLTWLKLHKNTT